MPITNYEGFSFPESQVREIERIAQQSTGIFNGQANAIARAIGDGTSRVLSSVLALALSIPNFGSAAQDLNRGSPAINHIVSLNYSVGALRNSAGNIYLCSVGGLAGAASPPTGTGLAIVDGTVTWTYLRADPDRWLASTAFARGRYVNNLGALYYCIQGGTSAGSGGPNTNNVNIADGSCLWNRVTNQYYDTVNGSDSNSGQNFTVPKKTLPANTGSNQRYLLPQGQIQKVAGTTPVNGITINGAAIILTVWDKATGNEGIGQANPFVQGLQGNFLSDADLYSKYFTFSGNSLEAGQYSSTLGKGIIVTSASPDFPLIRGWHVTNWGYAGILGSAGSGARIEDCAVLNNQRIPYPGNTYYGGTGIKFEGAFAANTAVIVRTYVAGSGEDGIWGANTPYGVGMVIKDCWIRHYGEQLKYSSQHTDAIQREDMPGPDLIERTIIEHQIGARFPLIDNDGSGPGVVGACYIAGGVAGADNPGGNMRDCILISDILLFNLSHQSGFTLTRCAGYWNYNDAANSASPQYGGIRSGNGLIEIDCKWMSTTLPQGFTMRYISGSSTVTRTTDLIG